VEPSNERHPSTKENELEHEQEHSARGVPLYTAPGGLPPPPPFGHRDQGLRRVRRATNWLIAFVLVAVGATSAELGHLANATRPVGATATPAASAPVAVSGGSAPVPASASRPMAPTLGAPVAISGGS
jgi:hypothetical protein